MLDQAATHHWHITVADAAVMATRCEDDKWSAEALACFGKATSAPELQKCDAGLSDAQRESLSRDISVVFGVAPS